MAWRMTGRSIELCSCKLFCPCWLGPAQPDQGWCSGAFALDIQEGNSDGVNLGGTKAVFVADWPGDFWAGQGTVRLYIDEAATAEQRRELEAILSGKKGGLWAAVSALVTRWVPTQVTKVEIQWGETLAVTVGTVGQATVQPLKDQAGRPTTVQGAAAMAAFELERMDLASAKGSRWSDPELRQWEGDSGTIHAFSWSA